MNREGKGGGYLEKKFFFAEEKENGDWKGILYLEKENIFFQRQRKPGKETRNIVGDRKYVFCGEDLQ